MPMASYLYLTCHRHVISQCRSPSLLRPSHRIVSDATFALGHVLKSSSIAICPSSLSRQLRCGILINVNIEFIPLLESCISRVANSSMVRSLTVTAQSRVPCCEGHGQDNLAGRLRLAQFRQYLPTMDHSLRAFGG